MFSIRRGVVADAFAISHCTDDDDAMKQARKYINAGDIRIWRDTKLIALLPKKSLT